MKPSSLEASLIEVPYTMKRNESTEKKSSASMLFILPDEQHECHLSDWLNNHLKWPTIVDSLNSPKANVNKLCLKIPKFAIKGELNVPRTLSKMGLKDIFTGSPDFSLMANVNHSFGHSIKIHDIIHKSQVRH